MNERSFRFLQPLRDLRPCLPFALAINVDPCLGDLMLRSQEQLQINLLSAQDKASHQAFGAYEGERLAGLFVFLILPDERYIEMLAGLTREPAAWKAMLARTVALNRPKGMSLLVDADNAPAVAAYAALGFERVENANSITASLRL